MKTKRIVAAIIAFVCIILGLTTLTKYGKIVAKTSDPLTDDQPKIVQAPVPNFTAGWSPAKQPVVKQVMASVMGQLDAFKRDDYVAAMDYQGSMLKHGISSPLRFRTMIKTEYPEFAAYKSITFGQALATNRDRAVQVPVKVTGDDGTTVGALYMLVLENGAYRIAGVEGGLEPRRGPQQFSIARKLFPNQKT